MKYVHTKTGNIYEVLSKEAKHTETLEELVVYRSLKDGRVWVRPHMMFFGSVKINGEEVPRFQPMFEE